VIQHQTLPGPFRVEYPEVYQLEVCSACQLHCKMCPREKYTRKDPRNFIEMSVVKKLIAEDSFRGSYFLELQMAGEPLLHPHLLDVVSEIKKAYPKLKLGLSTNGMLIKRQLQALILLDYITVSIDSVDEYEDIRTGGDVRVLREGIGLLLDNLEFERTALDLQIVELGDWQYQLEKVKSIYTNTPINVRTVPDCFRTVFEKSDHYPVKSEPCVNPWWSVSIQANGNVVPCCFSFGDDLIYGNVKDTSLEKIWRTSSTLGILRAFHSTGVVPELCKKCYMRSPAFLHWNIFSTSLKNK